MNHISRCDICEKETSSTLTCSKCSFPSYCSKNCQLTGLRSHAKNCNPQDKEHCKLTRKALAEISKNEHFTCLVSQILHHYSYYNTLPVCTILPINNKGKYLCHFVPIPDEDKVPTLPEPIKHNLSLPVIYQDYTGRFNNSSMIITVTFPKESCKNHYDSAYKGTFKHHELIFLGALIEVSKKSCVILANPPSKDYEEACNQADESVRNKMVLNCLKVRAHEITFSNKLFVSYVRSLMYMAFKKRKMIICEMMEWVGNDIYLYKISVDDYPLQDNEYVMMKTFYTENVKNIGGNEHKRYGEQVYSMEDCKTAYSLHEQLFSSKKLAKHGLLLRLFHGRCEFVGYDIGYDDK